MLIEFGKKGVEEATYDSTICCNVETSKKRIAYIVDFIIMAMPNTITIIQ